MIRTVTAVGIAVAVLAGATPAQAAPQSRLTLTYTAQAGYADAVKLTCNPTGGPHPEAAQACALLRHTGARPDRIRPAPVMCMMLYAPVTARLSGTWRGSRVTWSHQYGNGCEMTRATGVLFKF
jgi:Subtilisin inhibitor-like